jgi:hypothetical protein
MHESLTVPGRGNIGQVADVRLGAAKQARSMNHSPNSVTTPATPATAAPTAGATGVRRRFPATDMPIWLMLGLVALGVPRTLLADLDVVPPESGLLYYSLALTPFAAWLVVAVVRRTRSPIADFLILGVLYALSLVVIHQGLWELGPSLGYHPPESAVDFADRFDPSLRELAERAYTCGVAMAIGVGTGLVAAIVAAAARLLRSRRASGSTSDAALR